MRHANILNLLQRLRESYWFVPTLMAFAAVLLAGGMIWLDTVKDSQWMDRIAWLYASRPSGARQVLSSIGGSMITVAGTVFSVTIAAVVYASGQYGPRLLSNFMRDRGNQVTLGTFIATFLYCLIVLRTIRSPEESGGQIFVPNFALLVAVLLAICSIAVLIYFIHHVPSTIHINSVIEDIGERLLDEVDRRFPTFIGKGPAEGDDPADMAQVPATFRRGADVREGRNRQPIDAERTGYIQIVDDEALLREARNHDLVLRMQYQPGDFVHAGRTLVEAWPPAQCDDAATRAIRAAFSVGARRSAIQDMRFLIDELVEIGARALSPGTNDPFTAVTCLDWLGAAMSALVGRRLPSRLRLDEDGDLRAMAHPVTFENILERSFGALMPYCAADMVTALRYVRALGEVALDADDPDRLAMLGCYLDRFEALACEGLSGFPLSQVRQRAADVRRALAEPDFRRRLLDDTARLGGTA